MLCAVVVGIRIMLTIRVMQQSVVAHIGLIISIIIIAITALTPVMDIMLGVSALLPYLQPSKNVIRFAA